MRNLFSIFRTLRSVAVRTAQCAFPPNGRWLLRLLGNTTLVVAILLFFLVALLVTLPAVTIVPWLHFIHVRLLRRQLKIEARLSEVAAFWPELGVNASATTFDPGSQFVCVKLEQLLRELSDYTSSEIQAVIAAHPRINVRRLKDENWPRLVTEATRQLREQFPTQMAAIPSFVPKASGPRLIRFLAAFKWFCDKENRDNLDLIAADLRKDTKKMQKERRSRAFVQAVLLWRIFAGTLMPLIADSIIRGLQKVATAAQTVRNIRE